MGRNNGGSEILKRLATLVVDPPSINPRYDTEIKRSKRRLEKIPPHFKTDLERRAEGLLKDLEKFILF